MKLLGSLITAAALALSMLVAIPATTATAAGPYPGTVATSCSYGVPSSVKRKRQLNVAWRVTAGGNARPSGVVSFAVYKATNGGLRFVRGGSNGYTGPNVRVRSLGSFKKKGQYYTRMAFRPNNGSVYKACGTSLRGFRVTKR